MNARRFGKGNMATDLLNRVSYHAVYDSSILEGLRFAKENGFAGVQIADEAPHLSFERLSDREAVKIAEVLVSEGLYVTLHAPDETASLFQYSRYLSAGVLDYYRSLFSFAEVVGARAVTIHLGAMTVFPTDDGTARRIPAQDLPLYSTCLKKNIEAVLKFAAGRTMIFVENAGLGVAEFELLAPYLGRDGLFLCWDLAKGAGRPDVEACYLANPQWIKQVHLHDGRQLASGAVKGHRTIGTGDIDFKKALRFLTRNANVEDYCIEVRPREKARESLRALARIAQDVGAEPAH